MGAHLDSSGSFAWLRKGWRVEGLGFRAQFVGLRDIEIYSHIHIHMCEFTCVFFGQPNKGPQFEELTVVGSRASHSSVESS